MTELRVKTRKAREKITDRVSATVIASPYCTNRVWGQYLEPLVTSGDAIATDSQYGIFGTAAGIQIIAAQNATRYHPEAVEALETLPLLCGPAAALDPGVAALHDYYEKKGDLGIVFKLCAVLDAQIECELTYPQLDQRGGTTHDALVGRLFDIRVPNSGWPDFPNEDGTTNPSVHATAVALLALSRVVLTDAQLTYCEEAVAVLDTAEPSELSLATLVFTSVALDALIQQETRTDGRFNRMTIRSLSDKCADAVSEWIERTSPQEIRRSIEGTDYGIPRREGDRRPDAGHTFLLYLPHALAAWCVLRSERLRNRSQNRRFAMDVVGIVAGEFTERGLFRAAGRERQSTVEHLWLYRLMDAFESVDLYGGGLARVEDYIRRPRRGLLPAGLFVVVLALLFASTLVGGTPSDVLLIAGRDIGVPLLVAMGMARLGRRL